MSSIKSLKHRRACPKMSKKKRAELFSNYASKVQFKRMRAAYPAPAMHAASIRNGIMDRINECFDETGRLPEGKQNIRKRGYGGGRADVVFPSNFVWVESGYMCVIKECKTKLLR